MGNTQPHILLDDSVQVKYALLPGDPARLDRIAPFLENVQELAFNREYRSLVGEYKGVRILAISTGMGGASTAICIEELADIGISESMLRLSVGLEDADDLIADLIGELDKIEVK